MTTNKGHNNSGDYNSGRHNSGDYNSGHCNSGNHNSGHFNTDEPTVRMFNKDTGLKKSEINIPYIYLKLTEYVDGKLIERTYKEAWELAWKGLSESDKNKFLTLPNFCPKIFKEITGIDVEKKTKVITIDGKDIEISEESFEELKKQLLEK